LYPPQAVFVKADWREHFIVAAGGQRHKLASGRRAADASPERAGRVRSGREDRMGMTVLEVIQGATRYLEERGVGSARLQAEWLLAGVLGVPRLQLYLDFSRQVGASELDALRPLVRRRGRREPLQYILGTAVFCGLELRVSSAVLIPRPETEQLAERGWTLLKMRRIENSRSTESGAESLDRSRRREEEAPEREAADEEGSADGSAAPRVLDFGTGSGCLAIALAAHVPEAKITAVDRSEEALAVARANAQKNRVADRIEFAQADGLDRLQTGRGFDLLIANPPYVPTAEIARLEPEVRDHEPQLALDGGADGLEFYRLLDRQSPGVLRPQGQILWEFGDGQAESIRSMLDASGWRQIGVHLDLSGRPRFIEARRP